MIKQIAIVGQNKKRGELFFDWIAELYKKDIKTICRNSSRQEITLNNGDYYRNIPPENSARGCRFHQVFIEIGTDRHIIDCIIHPFLIPHSDISEENMEIYFQELECGYRFYRPVYGLENHKNIGIDFMR